MSDRDALADLLAAERDKHPRVPNDMDSWELADVLWAGGWRKKPSREEIIEALTPKPDGDLADSETWLSIREKMTAYYERDADAILALLDGGLSETGADDE